MRDRRGDGGGGGGRRLHVGSASAGGGEMRRIEKRAGIQVHPGIVSRGHVDPVENQCHPVTTGGPGGSGGSRRNEGKSRNFRVYIFTFSSPFCFVHAWVIFLKYCRFPIFLINCCNQTNKNRHFSRQESMRLAESVERVCRGGQFEHVIIIPKSTYYFLGLSASRMRS